MTTSRLAILLAVLLGGLSCVFLLPTQKHFEQPTGVILQLPEMVGGFWLGRDQEVGQKEHTVLGADTKFSRKLYGNGLGDSLQASTVLSGQDMNTSIHRPEWCLTAQGWTITDSSKVTIEIPDRGNLVATRLSSLRLLNDEKTGKPVKTSNGEPLIVRNLDYYWFVGYDNTTDSHMTRNLIDIKDRLMKGYNQRWAFMSVAGTITKNLRENGLDEEQTDELIQGFIKRLAPMTLKDTVKLH